MTTLGLTGGQVLRPNHSIERADVLIDQEDGTILAVEPAAGERADETLDASDSLVIPGLINAHSHVAMTLLRGYADDKPLESWLREDIWPAEGAMTPSDVATGARLGVAEMIRSGTTAFCDMYFEVPTIADVVETAGLRARLGHGVVTVGKSEAERDVDVTTGIEVAESLSSDRISTAIMPHSLTTVAPDSIERLSARARQLDCPVHFHMSETTAEVTPVIENHNVSPATFAREHGLLEPTDFVAHGVHLDDAEIETLAETETGVVHCPASNMKLASGMAPVQSMLDGGVTVGLGTDGAASNNDLDMFDEMRDAAMLGKLQADDASAVPASTVFRMATEGSAACCGFDSGRIEPNAPADLAVVDLSALHLTPQTDLISHLVYATTGADVRHTICDGKVLMEDRELLTLDEADIRASANQHARDLFERVA
ncbi:amidohydrolase [Halocatena halophila]|uniref:amidohydrolase n=1 Tax=Halocatena halophila TaxID=2814576 RepID=UPI002ED694AA